MLRKVEYLDIKPRELRATGDGIFEGYASVFDVEDSAGSVMKRGAFAKTLQERGAQIKILRNHTTLIGSPIEMREDDTGLFVRGQISLSTKDGAETYSLIQEGHLDGMSIAFTSMKETKGEGGIRELREVKLYEFGPVDFPANEAARITDVRSMEALLESVEPENRATDFNATLTDEQLRRGGYNAVGALYTTLDDIWWSGQSADETRTLMDAALGDFHASYIEWATAYMARYWDDEEMRSSMGANALAVEMRRVLAGRKAETLAAETTLTVCDINTMLSGDVIADQQRLSDLPEPLRQAHSDIRNEQVRSLFESLRDKLSPAERRRALALLQPAESQLEDLDFTELRTALADLTEVTT